ncbi:MAG: molybdopterin-dependent oxidoreductase [Spirochaetales bacterium]|nr:molybdopterin-dependent oxidoreductase [Spirochaetales bacterium]
MCDSTVAAGCGESDEKVKKNRHLYKKVLNVNGLDQTVIVDVDDRLVDVIRKQLGLTGTKVGCRAGQCGICSVLIDGKVKRACVVKMKSVRENAEIITIEGIGNPENLHPVQAAWIKHGGAQCGICSPGFIVSAKALLDQNQSPSREDVRDWFQKNRNACRCTGYKPLVDAVMDAAKVVRGEMKIEELLWEFKDGESILGSFAPRPSALAKVTGRWDYGADLGLKMPGEMLHLALVQSKVSHANILSIDYSKAEKMPGVECVLTAKDVQGTNRINGMATLPGNKCDGFDRPIICDEKIFMYGDVMAIVCADTSEHAKAAAAAVKVELEELPAYLSAFEAMEEDAMEIHPGVPNVYYELPTIKGGEVKPLIEKSAYSAEGSYYTTRQPHLILEPDVGFSYYDEDDRLTIHSKSICLYLHIDMLHRALGLDADKVRIVQNNMGATFGYKLSPTCEGYLGVATMATGKACYLEFDMHQTITYTGKRAPSNIDITMSADEEGRITALDYQHIFDHGAYSEWGDLVLFKGNMFIGGGYNIDNIRGYGKLVCTNHAYGTAFRAYGSPQALFASESVVDELALKMGMDPLEFRYKNVYREGSTTPTGQSPEVYPLPEMIDWLRPKYQAALKKAEAESTEAQKKGVGVALATYCVGGDFADYSEAWVELLPNGGAAVYNCWQDHGQGSDMGTLTIIHECLRPLNIPVDKIKLIMNDTAMSPDGGISAGSRGQVFFGNAMKDACDKMLVAMVKPDGSYRSYDEMKYEGKEFLYKGNYASGPHCSMIDEKTSQCKPMLMYMYGMIMSEVTVDTATGKTSVTKMTMAIDVGKVINRNNVDGQMYGGLAQGVGLALSENFDDLSKHVDLVRCGLPFIKDIPDEMELEYFESPREQGPFGASGVGELPLSSPHASVVNAIANACGVRIRELPATPDKVLSGLKKL